MATPLTLKRKITLLFVGLGTCFAVGALAVLRLGLMPTFADFERDAAQASWKNLNRQFETQLRALEVFNKEYSIWDQTYDFVEGRRPEYIEENMQPEYWRSVDIQMMLLYDNQARLIFGMVLDVDDHAPVPLEQALLSPLAKDHPLLAHDEVTDAVTGILRTHLGPMFVASSPIIHTSGEGPIAGTLINGQLLTAENVADFAARVSTSANLYSTDLSDMPPRVAAAVARLKESDETTYIEIAEDHVHSFEFLRDILGEPVGIIEVVNSREIAGIGTAVVHATGTALVAATVVFLLAALAFMNRFIISPIRRLTETILRIKESGDLSIEVGDYGDDEMGLLASEFSTLKTHLADSQQELEAARDSALESARAKSEFLARMSHEIRTPMNGVLGMTELLRDTPLNPKQQRFAKTIHESGESLLEIINDILDFSKMEAGKLKLERVEVDLHQFLEEIVEGIAMAAARKGIEIVNQIHFEFDHAVQLDPGRLRQVLNNLLSNAVKFTDEGQVVLRARATEESPARVSIHFAVSDTGIGIKPERQKDIFESFTQEDGSTTRLYGGTGLGLAISKQLIEMMGGELALESAPGHGSIFSFALDLKKGAPLDRPTALETSLVAGKHALVVDDNDVNREILEHQLSGWRAHAECAASADEALVKLESSIDAGDPFDFAILDIHMPRKDGIELAEEIRRNPKLQDLRLIVLSSVATSVAKSKMDKLGISGQLAKPIRQSHLYDALSTMLAGKTVSQPGFERSTCAGQSLTGRVLLAEDNMVNRMVAAGMLESMGIEVVMAKDGEEAIRKATMTGLDLILMDCQMPKMDGYAATREIRKREKVEHRGHTPIVALTANALKGDRERCLEAGMDEYLSKPFTSEQLYSVLSLYVGPAAKTTARAAATAGENAASLEDQPPIDRSALDALAELQQPGDDDFIDVLIGAYLDSAHESRDRLVEAIAANDAARIAEIAHGLKSSSANLGAVSLADLCLQLENKGRDDDLTGVSDLHAEFEAEFGRVVEALESERNSEAA